MSVTVTNPLEVPYRISGNKKKAVRDIEFDSSYTESGEKLTKAQMGLSSVEYSTEQIRAVKGSVNVANASWDSSKELIHLYDETPGEVASEANVEGVVVRVEAFGT
jgi:hypothetical protein